MLLDDLSQYLKQAEVAIRNLKEAYIERYEEEIIASNRKVDLDDASASIGRMVLRI